MRLGDRIRLKVAIGEVPEQTKGHVVGRSLDRRFFTIQTDAGKFMEVAAAQLEASPPIGSLISL